MCKCPVCGYDPKHKDKINYTNKLLYDIFTARRKQRESWKAILADLSKKIGMSKITVYRRIRNERIRGNSI